MRILSAVLVLLALSGLAGCATPASGQTAQAVATNRVDMPVSYRFDPAVVRVPVGTAVTWTNHDNFTHDVHVLGGLDWRSQPLRPGESASYTFTKAGTYPYLCDFHAHDMKGTVIVSSP